MPSAKAFEVVEEFTSLHDGSPRFRRPVLETVRLWTLPCATSRPPSRLPKKTHAPRRLLKKRSQGPPGCGNFVPLQFKELAARHGGLRGSLGRIQSLGNKLESQHLSSKSAPARIHAPCPAFSQAWCECPAFLADASLFCMALLSQYLVPRFQDVATAGQLTKRCLCRFLHMAYL